MAQYTPEEFGHQLERFASGFKKAVNDALFVATNEVYGDFKQRIFNTTGTRDIKGNTRKYKSKSHVKRRKLEKNLTQLTNVDLIFTGNLQSSVKQVTIQGKGAIAISGEKNQKKAKGNEKYFKDAGRAAVFEASKEEEKKAQEVFDKQISIYINKYFD